MAKKNQLTKSDYLPMEDYKKLLYLLHKDRQYLWELYARLAFCTATGVRYTAPNMVRHTA